MTVAETFRTWSVCETLIAVAAQLLATQPIDPADQRLGRSAPVAASVV